ncbi:MAG: hypothetical protein PHG96_05770 [Kiritimatiellae bacterium]|nr:hypothetical protein [Kiritimatiellia bacterium]
MRIEKRRIASIEDDLRQTACPLRAPDLGRVERVCRRIALASGVGGAAVAPRAGFFRNPLLRVAAALLLLAGVVTLSRLPGRDHGIRAITFVNPAPLLDQMAAFTETRALTQALTAESFNLLSDLAMLATAVNDNSFAILF